MKEILIACAVVSGVGLLAGIMLTVFSKLFAVPVDETAEKINAVLPGANCGGCGYSGCSGYADAVAAGTAPLNLCSVGGPEVAAKIGEITGKSVAAEEKRIAVINCGGNNSATKKRFNYKGINSCAAASLVHGGDSACEYGCLGYGDCVSACDFNALSLVDGLPTVCKELCTSCGKCTKVCPKGLMKLKPFSKAHTVACSSKLVGGKQRKICTAGCIGCGKCVKVCPSAAIKVDSNLAKIDYSVCTSCGLCRDNCPVHCIT